MKQLALTCLISFLSFGLLSQSQIIANHTIVADYDKIPDHYINEVKKMLVCFSGRSHSLAYKSGPALLEALDDTYASNKAVGEEYTDQYLRVNDDLDGEYKNVDTWFSWKAWDPEDEDYPTANANLIKDALSSYNAAGTPFSALGYGWCTEMHSSYTSSQYDDVYPVKWMGVTLGGPEGEPINGWGLDAEDFSITGSSVSLANYFEAMEEYIQYCKDNNIPTKMIFSTAPLQIYSGTPDRLYQAQIKHDKIREYVAQDSSRILFDYTDILAYDDGSDVENIGTYTYEGTDYIYKLITPTNEGTGEVGHIDAIGAVRIAKAMWWMLARIAGWDGNTTTTQESTIESNKKDYISYQNNNHLIIKLEDSSTYDGFCSLFSIQGKLIEKKKIRGSQITIDTNSYPTGMYLITLSGQKATRFKVVVP